jgi:hypothetical protein
MNNYIQLFKSLDFLKEALDLESVAKFKNKFKDYPINKLNQLLDKNESSDKYDINLEQAAKQLIDEKSEKPSEKQETSSPTEKNQNSISRQITSQKQKDLLNNPPESFNIPSDKKYGKSVNIFYDSVKETPSGEKDYSILDAYRDKYPSLMDTSNERALTAWLDARGGNTKDKNSFAKSMASMLSPNAVESRQIQNSKIIQAIKEVVKKNGAIKYKDYDKTREKQEEVIKIAQKEAENPVKGQQPAIAYLFWYCTPVIVKYYWKYIGYAVDENGNRLGLSGRSDKGPEDWVGKAWEILVQKPTFNSFSKEDGKKINVITFEQMNSWDIQDVMNLDTSPDTLITSHGALSYFDVKSTFAENLLLSFAKKYGEWFLRGLGIKENGLKYSTVSEIDESGNKITYRVLVDKEGKTRNDFTTESGETLSQSDLKALEDWQDGGNVEENTTDAWVSLLNNELLFQNNNYEKFIQFIKNTKEKGLEDPETYNVGIPKEDFKTLIAPFNGTKIFDRWYEETDKYIGEILEAKNKFLKKTESLIEEIVNNLREAKTAGAASHNSSLQKLEKKDEQFLEYFKNDILNDRLSNRNNLFTPIAFNSNRFKTLSYIDMLYLWIKFSKGMKIPFAPALKIRNEREMQDRNLNAFSNYFVMAGLKPGPAKTLAYFIAYVWNQKIFIVNTFKGQKYNLSRKDFEDHFTPAMADAMMKLINQLKKYNLKSIEKYHNQFSPKLPEPVQKTINSNPSKPKQNSYSSGVDISKMINPFERYLTK